jgi:hypothetical protein
MDNHMCSLALEDVTGDHWLVLWRHVDFGVSTSPALLASWPAATDELR